MKKISLIVLLLVFGNLYSQTVTISGKITSVPNPCQIEPCIPGLVYAIETDSIYYIITWKGYWIWSEPIVIETYIFEMGDPITVEGVVSVGQDIWGEDYYEIAVASVIPLSIDNDVTAPNMVSIFPNPTIGKVYIEMESNIKVYNMRGALLLETFGNQVDLSAYPQGVYFLRVNGGWAKMVKN